MATDPKWAALRKWLKEESRYWADAATTSGREVYGGQFMQCERMLHEMTRLSRQRPKTGAKKR